MTEWRYIAAFAAHLSRCDLVDGEVVALLSESQSRPALVETARLAAQSLGGRVFDVVVPTPASTHSVPIRSTGASQAIAGNAAVISALSIIGLAPKGQKLKAYFALGWWRFAQVEAIAGPAAAPYIARYRKAFLAFFACIFAAMLTTILLIFLQQN